MKLKIEVWSHAADTDYGGEQTIEAVRGEHLLDGIFRLHFFRIIIDDVIGDALCFRLMEGAEPHYFVLEGEGDSARFERTTPLGGDEFLFTLTGE